MSVPSITLNDGNRIPQFGLGVFLMPPEQTKEHVAFALANGYRHIDTAAVYGNEREVGQAIAESGVPRDEIFVTTKLWNNRQTDAPAALAESLEKLGLDQVDLYLIHWPTPEFDTYLQAWHSLEQLQADGLTRSIGVSNFHQQHLQRLIDSSDVVPAVNQIEVHPSLPQFDLVDVNNRLGIATEAWSPLGRRSDLDNEVIVEIARRIGRTPAQVILRWHIQRDIIVFPKASSPERLRENADIFDFELSADDKTAIDGVDSGNRVGSNPETMNRR
ncbi:MAG: aldo/keto reductase [Micropruina sp.]|uniref:aldo/keto reductase n=1 Tax=Micropruina sp. TaxID=2737536 RepID=UPI0039E2E932